ncbi:unnamed protein product [Echinostoma caproni]|uniref:Actin n=1 Tax=Echinostoma caproni TaxID=27848 RepID=A0A183B184_9TREM|nr:unnamed protein product [Echinostoma caproni]
MSDIKFCSNENTPIVFDNGSTYLKAGFAGEASPRVLLPSVIGRFKINQSSGPAFIGEHALRNRGVLHLSCPILQGIVTSWSDLDAIWRHMFFKELKVDPQDHPLLVADYPLLPSHSRELMAQFAFEEFRIPALFIADQSVLALCAYGLTSGLSVDIGKQSTCIVPVTDMQIVPKATIKLTVGGRDVTNYLKRLLVQQGYSLNRATEHEIVRDIKEHLCFVSESPEIAVQPKSSASDLLTKYHLPDGSYLTVGTEQIIAPELLFNPGTRNEPGFQLGRLVRDSIETCAPHVHDTLYTNITPSGGGTMFRGFVERLQKEVTRLCPAGQTVCVHSNPDRKYAVWIGGSILGSLSTFSDICVTRKQYEEDGIRSVYKK